MRGFEPSLAGVIGHPVAHSLSPEIFSFLAGRAGRELQYRRIDLPAERLLRALRGARELGVFTGWNVTIPHKERVARAMDRLSPEAAFLRAVNVVEFLSDGKLAGHNTDVLGIESTLEERGIRVRGERVVLLGAGGAALAAGYALGKQGAREVTIVNRGLERARRAAGRLRRGFGRTRFLARSLERFRSPGGEALFIHATSVGMMASGAEAARARRRFDGLLEGGPRRGAVAFDLIYRPEQTPFLSAAEKAGMKTVGGLDMLIWQALASWEIWFGALPGARRQRLKSALARHLRGVLGEGVSK